MNVPAHFVTKQPANSFPSSIFCFDQEALIIVIRRVARGTWGEQNCTIFFTYFQNFGHCFPICDTNCLKFASFITNVNNFERFAVIVFILSKVVPPPNSKLWLRACAQAMGVPFYVENIHFKMSINVSSQKNIFLKSTHVFWFDLVYLHWLITRKQVYDEKSPSQATYRTRLRISECMITHNIQ